MIRGPPCGMPWTQIRPASWNPVPDLPAGLSACKRSEMGSHGLTWGSGIVQIILKKAFRDEIQEGNSVPKKKHDKPVVSAVQCREKQSHKKNDRENQTQDRDIC